MAKASERVPRVVSEWSFLKGARRLVALESESDSEGTRLVLERAVLNAMGETGWVLIDSVEIANTQKAWHDAMHEESRFLVQLMAHVYLAVQDATSRERQQQEQPK